MTFTYNINALTTPLAQVRLEIGDTVSATPLFADEEIAVKLAGRNNHVLHTAADLCQILATRTAGEFDFETDGQSFKRSQKKWAEMAATLRARAEKEGGLSVVPVTRIDGYSDDLSTRDTAGTGVTGHVRRGYYDDDMPA